MIDAIDARIDAALDRVTERYWPGRFIEPTARLAATAAEWAARKERKRARDREYCRQPENRARNIVRAKAWRAKRKLLR